LIGVWRGSTVSSNGNLVGHILIMEVSRMKARANARIDSIGKTVDREGRVGFCISTLQAREQHIRRGKATSICTNWSGDRRNDSYEFAG
jgi:hypothetical protein